MRHKRDNDYPPSRALHMALIVVVGSRVLMWILKWLMEWLGGNL